MDGFRILVKTVTLVSAFVIFLSNPASGFFCTPTWDWVVLENGVPTALPYVLIPSSYNQYDPPWVFNYEHPYPNLYNWTQITFEQISGPSQEFGTTTIYRDTAGGCYLYLQGAASPLSASPPPGIYTIRATVLSGVMKGGVTTSSITTGTSTITVPGGPTPVPAISGWGALALVVLALSTGAFLLIRRSNRLSEWKRSC